MFYCIIRSSMPVIVSCYFQHVINENQLFAMDFYCKFSDVSILLSIQTKVNISNV